MHSLVYVLLKEPTKGSMFSCDSDKRPMNVQVAGPIINVAPTVCSKENVRNIDSNGSIKAIAKGPPNAGLSHGAKWMPGGLLISRPGGAPRKVLQPGIEEDTSCWLQT